MNPGGSSAQRFVKPEFFLEHEDILRLKEEVKAGHILIVHCMPYVRSGRNMKKLKRWIDELKAYTLGIGGDIARLGWERIVMTPPGIKIWRSPDRSFRKI